MDQRTSLWIAFRGTFFALVVSYLICLAGDLIFGWSMYQIWAPLLPGFEWPLSVSGFLLGLVWLALYAAYIPLVVLLPLRFLKWRATQS